MLIKAHYVIRPKVSLTQKLASFTPDVAEGFLEPQLWSRDEGGRTAWEAADYESVVKMIFLAHWISFAAETPASEYAGIVGELMGPAPHDFQVFDRWWSLERFAGEPEDADEIVSELMPGSFDTFDPTVGSELVQSWVAQHKTPA